jgi:hypothetical protein
MGHACISCAQSFAAFADAEAAMLGDAGDVSVATGLAAGGVDGNAVVDAGATVDVA